MTGQDFAEYLAEGERRYPDLFGLFRRHGWSEQWVVDEQALAAEPYWGEEGPGTIAFPRNEYANRVLKAFHGWSIPSPHLEFGCRNLSTASSLLGIRPYEVETFILKEMGSRTRPPAFPIGPLRSFVIFVRDDSTAISVAHNWIRAFVSDDLFHMLDTFLFHSKDGGLQDLRRIDITDENDVPTSVLSAYRAMTA